MPASRLIEITGIQRARMLEREDFRSATSMVSQSACTNFSISGAGYDSVALRADVELAHGSEIQSPRRRHLQEAFGQERQIVLTCRC